MTEPRHCSGCRGYTKNWQAGCGGITLAGRTLEDVLTEYARCNLAGDAVSPDDLNVIRDFSATLIARSVGNTRLHWRELMAAHTDRAYWLDWYCPNPLPHQSYQMKRWEWGCGADGRQVLSVYEIEVTGAPEGETAGGAGSPERAGPAGPGAGRGEGTPVAEAEAPAPGARPGGTGGGQGFGPVPR